ncbi:glycosyltransferase family 4 protein [Microseira wollei]|uniref:Glycosyl transferase, group 1 n=1 Tax=Microseira wollei NIES-4236 TaxID=2530354 RepID=A0AAV3X328_9CYAN|nr:glycosyltransferase family 4 protein [Microseira wollei]GET35683.1 putative glycosyl transferase, group 1 [Microseira wollei NIES-4236]
MTIPKIRTLFITKMTYPPLGGVPMRNWQNINIMMNFGPVAVFSVYNEDSSNEAIEGVTIWHHYNVAKHPSLWLRLQRGIWWLRLLGLNDYWAYLQPAAAQLNEIMKSFQPDVVIIEELWLYHYLSVVQKYQCQIIFDEHNVEASLFETIRCSVSSVRSWARKKLHLPQIKFTENDLIRKSAQVWVCSKQDKNSLEKLYGAIPHSYLVPNGINLKYYDCVGLGECEPSIGLEKSQLNILFTGHFGYVPNSEAAELLINQIYPKLLEVYPDSRMLLVGRGATQFMYDAAQQNSNIIVTGEVEDIRPYLAGASVMVVPLYKGGGTRFKILEAFAAGCPVVSTTKGAEGLNAENGVHLLLGDDVDSMTKAIVKLWLDRALQEKLANNAYDLVQSKYSWEAVAENIKFAMADLSKHKQF